MTDSDPQGAPAREEPFRARALLVLAWLVWVASLVTVAILWFGAAITIAPFFGTIPTPDQLSGSRGLLIAAAIVAGVAAILMVALVALVGRRRPLRFSGSLVLVIALLTPCLPLLAALSFNVDR
ncbi:hypothetical protein ACFSBZ_15955 [Amnibacterium flavum]|uniref:Uncharacterized protein n=1 Tax=Amnibacterium flavum TaxID=2173173 RepID=A0A2V1HWE0_9MICO|nr:hypothetical protein [Amnibacterium flavum]PVZ96192.1 hypothetical protein DDQ50_07140 [Amnibacterium flavum]